MFCDFPRGHGELTPDADEVLLGTATGIGFYERMIPVADDLYDVYLQELEEEGLIK